MLKNILSTSVVGLCLAISSLSAQQPAPSGQPAIVTDTIGSQPMRMAVRPGECALDKANPLDKRALDLTAEIVAVSNFLHLITADCQELAEWRVGKVKFLGDGMQIQSLKAAANENFRGQEKTIVTQICDQFRTGAGDIANQAEDVVKKRFEESKTAARLESLKLVGVMGQDENACYVAARVSGKNELGEATTKLMVFATLVVEGKLLYLYRFTTREDNVVYKDLMAEISQDVTRQYAANKK